MGMTTLDKEIYYSSFVSRRLGEIYISHIYPKKSLMPSYSANNMNPIKINKKQIWNNCKVRHFPILAVVFWTRQLMK